MRDRAEVMEGSVILTEHPPPRQLDTARGVAELELCIEPAQARAGDGKLDEETCDAGAAHLRRARGQ